MLVVPLEVDMWGVYTEQWNYYKIIVMKCRSTEHQLSFLNSLHSKN